MLLIQYLFINYPSFNYLKKYVDQMDSISTNFLWDFKGDSPIMHLLAKGLSIRNTHLMNKFLLSKFIGRIVSKQTPWKVNGLQIDIAKKTLTGNFRNPHFSSWVWISIVCNEQLIIAYLRWKVGQGSSISIHDRFWCNHQTNPANFTWVSEWVEGYSL